jgi:hypothetical protein
LALLARVRSSAGEAALGPIPSGGSDDTGTGQVEVAHYYGSDLGQQGILDVNATFEAGEAVVSPIEHEAFKDRILVALAANYIDVWSTANTVRYLINSFQVAIPAVVVSIAGGTLIGYALAKFRPRGGTAIQLVIVSGLFVPPQVLLVPRFTMFRSFDLLEEVVDWEALERFTEHTITDRQALLDDMAATAERGFALDNEGLSLGVRCVASPVVGIGGNIRASIGISGPTTRLDAETIGKCAVVVCSAAKTLSEILGGQWDFPLPSSDPVVLE